MTEWLNRERFLVERLGGEYQGCPLEPFYAGQWIERERIIKLLEDKAPKCNEQEYNFLGCDCSISYHDAIALIKGDQN